MKKQSNLSRLLEIAGSHKYLTYASWVLSAISALIALVPFYYIWKMINVNNGELVPSARFNCTTLPKQEYRLAGWLYRSAAAPCRR